jgi:hypothetical protein
LASLAVGGTCTIRVAFTPASAGTLNGTVTLLDGTGGQHFIQLSGAGQTPVISSITATGGTPQSTTIQDPFAAPLQATVLDNSSQPVAGVRVTFAAPSSGASATLSSTTATTNSSGVASVTATANGSVGSYSVTASVAGVGTPASFSLTNNASAGPPTIVSLTPNAGGGQAQVFTAVYSDPNGVQDFKELQFMVNPSVDASFSCYVYYRPQTNRLSLSNDAGTAGLTPALTPGGSGTLANSQCTLNANSSSVNSSGNNLTLQVSLTFASSVFGPRNVFLEATGLSGQSSGWVQSGTWTPGPSAGAPGIVSLTPNSGSGNSEVFTAVYSDPNGAADISEALLEVNTNISPVSACRVLYYPQSNQLLLLNDAGTALLAPALTPGGSGTLANSQCTLNASTSSTSSSGNNLTLNVSLTLAGSLLGPRNVYLNVFQLDGQSSGWVQAGSWTPNASSGPPAIVSLTPNSGSAMSQVFTAVYTDPNGAADLNEALLMLSPVVSASNSCYVYYSPQGNQLLLRNDAGTAWLTPALTPGGSGSLTNSQCTLNAATSSTSVSGNNLTVNVSLTFTSSLLGSNNIYLNAFGLSGQSSGWVQSGTWMPNPTAGPPTIVSVTPSSGTGLSQVFTAVYSDPNGVNDLNEVLLLVNPFVSTSNSCYVYYNPQGNQLSLRNDAGTAWLTPALTPGGSGTLANSQCTLNASSSSVSTSTNSLTLGVSLTFFSTWAGPRNVYMNAFEANEQSSGWVLAGIWTPMASAGSPTIASLTPSSGAGQSQVFSAVYSDPNGAADLNEALLMVSGYVSASGSCYVLYSPQGNQLYLRNDAGTAWLTPALTPGGSGTLSNSQCTLNAVSSSVNSSGNNLTVNVSLTFAGSILGQRNVFLNAFQVSGQSTGWVQSGTWTPNPSVGPPTITSVSPSSGSGLSQVFTAVYSDPNGAADLNEVLLMVNPYVSSSGSCFVYYFPQTNLLYLRNDAGTAWLTPALTPGGSGTVANSQCTLAASTSSANASGNNLTLAVALTFASTVAGPRNVYMNAFGLSGQTSGWVQTGTWTPNASAGPPSIVSVTPDTGNGQSQIFSAVYSDPNGVTDLSVVSLAINTSITNVNTCRVYYYPQSNELLMLNDAGTAFLTPTLTPGGSGTVANSQCTLNATSSSVSTSGNNLTVNVSLTFAGTFAGERNLYLIASGLGGQSSGWVLGGNWTP